MRLDEEKEQQQEEIRNFVLDKRKEGKIVFMTFEGLVSVELDEFIKQPVDGLLYDLNRLEEVSLTFIDDPKWINDFAVALVIRELKSKITRLETKVNNFEKELREQVDGWPQEEIDGWIEKLALGETK